MVCVWYLVFVSHFKDQFLFKDQSWEESPLLDPRSSPVIEQDTSNIHALSFDVDEETPSTMIKSSGDPGDIKRMPSSKGGRKKVNIFSDPKGGFVPYNEATVKKFSVQMSEESSIVKAEQMDLIASWLPGTALHCTLLYCTPHRAIHSSISLAITSFVIMLSSLPSCHLTPF